MSLDPATLSVVACIMSAAIGGLLLFSWYHDRRTPALGWWSLCGLMSSVASIFYILDGATLESLGRQIANGLFALAFGLSYGAARRFNGKPMRWPVVIAGALVWTVAALAFEMAFFERLVIMSVVVGGYGLITSRELWTQSAGMPSQRAAAVVTAINGLYFLLRPLGGPGIKAPIHGAPVEPTAGWLAVVGIVIILYAMIFGFLILAMAKEKADLVHRRAALIDPLTGVSNRRAFMIDACRLLGEAQRANRPAAVVMFDLDHFKAVNDGHGHVVGDQTLIEFCNAAAAIMPARSTLGRLGGEEFAIFVDGFDYARAVEMAEAIRSGLAEQAAVVMGRPVAATVSAGVSSSPLGNVDLADLIAAADSALYRAKAQGRNRVVAELHRAEPTAFAVSDELAVA